MVPVLGPPREDLGATFANKPANGPRVVPMRTPRGHIRRRGSRYEIAVPVGRDPITKRYRYAYDSAGTEEEAERRRTRADHRCQLRELHRADHPPGAWRAA